MSIEPMSSRRIIVYIDGFCLYCQAAARTIERLDILRWVRVISYRHDSSYQSYSITSDAINEAMHVVRLKGATLHVVSGYAAVVEVVKNLPALWLFLPTLWLVGLVGWGERAYRWLAKNRILVADSRQCDNGACRIK